MDTRTETQAIGPSVHITFDRYPGVGTPVVLLHGIPGGRRTWRQVASGLQPHHPVIVPDLLGFGGSAEPPDNYHAPGQSAAISELLNTIGIGDAHLVGFDLGGAVALMM